MEISVHTGANTTRVEAAVAADLAAVGTITLRIDASQPGDIDRLLEAACQDDLFATAHIIKVDHVEKLSTEVAEELAASATGAVIAGKSHGTFTKKLERAFGETITVTKHNAPKGKSLTAEIKALGSDAGIALSVSAVAELQARCANDLLRARSICQQLAAAGFVDPNPAQIKILAGTSEAAPAPWDVSDALDAGRISQMLSLAAASAPVPTAMWVADHVLFMARITENNWNTDQATAGLGIHKFRASNLTASARRFGPERCRAAAVAATELDRASKSGDPAAKVAMALARVALALHA